MEDRLTEKGYADSRRCFFKRMNVCMTHRKYSMARTGGGRPRHSKIRGMASVPFCLSLLLPTLGCQEQLVINDTPCATMNEPIQLKPSTEMSFVFGTDAVRAALDVMLARQAKERNVSDNNLTNSGADSAVRIAAANGRNPTASDVSALKSYLSKEVVPMIHQHPACDFIVSAVGKPYVSVEGVAVKTAGERRLPQVTVVNTGQSEAQCHVFLKQFLAGREHSSGAIDFRLGPDQRRGLSMRDVPLPMADIESGKSRFLILVSISYAPEIAGTKIWHQEAWQYDTETKGFVMVSLE